MVELFKKFTVLLCLVFLSGNGFGMSIFDAGKVCTFSKVSGVILREGKPVAGARVVRETDYQSKHRDETVTDSEGYFEMPSLFERSVTSLLPQEFVVGQTLKVEVAGEEQKIFSGVKRKKEEMTESRGEPFNITCELTDEDVAFYIDGNAFVTRCTWDAEHDEIDNGF